MGRIGRILRPSPNYWWTVGGAIPILWNATHWRRGPHVSGMARKHPLVTVLVLAAYGYHFIGPEKKREILEEVASAAAAGTDVLRQHADSLSDG